MTVEIHFREVATSMSQLTISGVNVKDINTVPESAIDHCPLLFPVPNNFVTDVQFTVASLGNDDSRKLNLEYTLNYRYLHAPIGSGAVLETYVGIIENLTAILVAIASDSFTDEAVDYSIQSVSDLGAVTDIAGQTMFHGVDISIRVLEYIQ